MRLGALAFSANARGSASLLFKTRAVTDAWARNNIKAAIAFKSTTTPLSTSTAPSTCSPANVRPPLVEVAVASLQGNVTHNSLA